MECIALDHAAGEPPGDFLAEHDETTHYSAIDRTGKHLQQNPEKRIKSIS